jgi:uncharacterized protein YciU (UPF0263 family)
MAEFTGLPMLAQYPQWVRGPARIVEDEVVLDGERAERYYLHDNENELMFDFAALAADFEDLDERDVLAFVRRYGLLRHGAEDLDAGECRESLVDILVEAAFFAELLDLYTRLKKSIRAGSTALLRTGPIDVSASLGLGPTDDDSILMARASILLGEQITKALAGCSHGVVSAAVGFLDRSPDRFMLSIVPPDLLSLVYTRFAQILVERVPMAECPGCGRSFVPKSGKQKYCASSCASTSRWRRWKEGQAE